MIVHKSVNSLNKVFCFYRKKWNESKTVHSSLNLYKSTQLTIAVTIMYFWKHVSTKKCIERILQVVQIYYTMPQKVTISNLSNIYSHFVSNQQLKCCIDH